MSSPTSEIDEQEQPELFKFEKYDDFRKKFIRQNEYVSFITFNLGRWGKIKQTFYFEYTDKMTVKKTIRHVETWLSQSITDSYYNMLLELDDLCESYMSSNRGHYEIRGDALGGRILIDDIIFTPCKYVPNSFDITLCLVA